MARISLTQAAKDELDRHNTRFRPQGFLVKNGMDANTRDTTEVTDNVQFWGRLVTPATHGLINWEKSNLTVTLVNKDNLYNPEHADSVFQQSPVVDPLKVWYEYYLYVLVGELGTPELVRFYRGIIMDVVLRYDESLGSVELVTTLQQNHKLGYITKDDGYHTALLDYAELP